MTTNQTGTVKWFNEDKGYGFIAPDAGGKGDAGAQRVGKYLVSPLIKAQEDGSFASSVSIRSGSGRGTTDRVLRLARVFDCATEAAAGAHAEARRWIDDSRAPRMACAS